MQRIPPIAPIAAKGPLGLAHLPRMWSKTLQEATGHLVAGYKTGCYFDRILSASLGIDVQEAFSFVRSTRPTYLEFEAWVLAGPAGAWTPSGSRRRTRPSWDTSSTLTSARSSCGSSACPGAALSAAPRISSSWTIGPSSIGC